MTFITNTACGELKNLATTGANNKELEKEQPPG